MGKLLSPAMLASVAILLGCGFVVAGLYLMAGLGWALIAASVPCFVFSILIFRGLTRA
jgi:hypothetical protein